jgi:PAS domain-containing protein
LSSARAVTQWDRTSGDEAIFAAFSNIAGQPIQTVTGVPLLGRGGRVGSMVLLLHAKQGEGRLDRPTLELLAGCASTALANAAKFTAAKRDQERMLLFAESTGEVLWDWNLEQQTLWWGGGVQNLMGPGAVVVHNDPTWKLERIHHQDRERVRMSLEAALRSSESSWTEEYRLLRSDGTFAAVEDRGYFLRHADARAYRVIGALRDVSALRAVSERLRTVTNNATLALFLLNARHECTYLNPAAEQLTGAVLGDLKGKTLHAAVHLGPDGAPLHEGPCPLEHALVTRTQERGASPR